MRHETLRVANESHNKSCVMIAYGPEGDSRLESKGLPIGRASDMITMIDWMLPIGGRGALEANDDRHQTCGLPNKLASNPVEPAP